MAGMLSIQRIRGTTDSKNPMYNSYQQHTMIYKKESLRITKMLRGGK